ncbi:coiled-coil domain-containing protein 174-like isoform X2 [Anneissia japonica]|uniref:coiled-coil domain-containing protein 174-like isoform X2 n=1 Tax=Anneissia japonica TaxID=1529436 RepID=UPI00142576C9|nr:coiled-coil domain-containing protein 174-like isoform X2 [Anneissia japonica]
MSFKNNIKVNASSLVGLKAELFKKQQEFQKERLENSNVVKAKSAPKKPSLWSKKNAGVNQRAAKDQEAASEDKKSLDKSRASLEAKSKLYDEMTKANYIPDEDGSGRFLVDFEQKALSKIKNQSQKSDEEEDVIDNDNIPEPAGPQEEWVDYVDSLGRSRRCMRKDLADLIAMDKELVGPEKGMKEDETDENPQLLSSDMYREMLRKKWEKEEEDALNRPSGPVHYQNVRYDEVRDMGVGYFQFAKDVSQRSKQMEALETLRDETVDQRARREKLKEKRKAAMNARLEKIKQRKRMKGELIEDEEEVKVEVKKEEETITTEAALPTTSIGQKLTTHTKIREWDLDKDPSDFPKNKWRTDRSQERDPMFAPPSVYNSQKSYNHSKGNNFNNHRKKDDYLL